MKKLIIPALLAGLLLCACTIFPEDTAGGLYAPEINPEPVEGILEQQTLQLYFPMANEPYMCSQIREVEVPANSAVETVLLAQILEGPKAPGELTAVLDGNVKAAVTKKGTVLEVTLSREYLDRTNVVDEANERLRRRLSIYCIVNTLTSDDPSLSVQILVDDDGNVRKPTYEEVGMTKPVSAQDALEPLTFAAEYILTLRRAADNVLSATASRDADKLHNYLFSEARPSADELQEALYSVLLVEYNINSDSETGSNVNVDLTLSTGVSDSEPIRMPGRTIPFVKEGDVWKVDYRSLESLIFIEIKTPHPSITFELPAD